MALILVFLFVLCTMAGPATAQKIEIALRDSPLPFTPDGFYIADVIDMRDYRDAVSWFNAVKRFIDHNVPKNTSLHPVEIGLKTFRLTETKLPDNRVEGHVNLNLSFDLQTAYAGPQHLTGYNGRAVYSRNAGNPQDIAPILTHALENGLAYFNNWMNKAAETNIYLAKGVKLSFTDYKEKTEGDTIYYAADRPLTWADFQSNVANSKYDADVFPSIGYDEQLEVNKGVINIRIDLKAFLPKAPAG